MNKNVFTYYMPVPGLWPEDTQFRLIEIWKKSWAKHGWNPVVLNEDHAKKHSRYADFKKRFWEFPTEYGHDYEGACFMRYVAASAMGGGMMTDYDVINYGLRPEHVGELEKKFQTPQFYLFANREPRDIFCGQVYGCRELFEGICQIFYSWKMDQRDFVSTSKTYRGYHLSDLTMFQQLFDGRREKPAWLRLVPGCALYPEYGWKYTPTTHYGFAMNRDGHWPKCDHIERLRPI